MKCFLIMILSMLMLPGCSNEENAPVTPPPAVTGGNIRIVAGSEVFTASLYGNEGAEAFKTLLPISVPMGELNGNEKYYYLDGNLPVSASNPGIIRNGDLMLYGSNCLVLFYKTFTTSYRYTMLGRIDNPAGLETALGEGVVSVRFELNN